MEYSTVWGIALALICVATFIFALIVRKHVLKHSVKLKELRELNQKTTFHVIVDKFEVFKFYDNKSNFNRIEPAFVMSAELRSQVERYTLYARLLRENREKMSEYTLEVQRINDISEELDFKALKIPKFIFKIAEKKLFAKNTLKPVTDCVFNVRMSYSSPKGKVNLSKSGSFSFEDMFVCLESVSRHVLDRATREHLIAVERGEVSDSLRYDILNRDNFTCVICGASARQGVHLHVDHIVPVSKGGKSTPDNLRTLCERCNIGKSNKIETNLHADTDEICPLCGGKLVLREGKYGSFHGCGNFPKCKFTKK